MALLGFGSSGAIPADYPKILEKGGYRLLVIVSILSCALIIVTLLTANLRGICSTLRHITMLFQKDVVITRNALIKKELVAIGYA